MDAEGFNEEIPCPECGSVNTVTYRYVEGFSELECPNCGYRSDSQELAELTRFQGSVLERGFNPEHAFDERVAEDPPPVPIRAIKA